MAQNIFIYDLPGSYKTLGLSVLVSQLKNDTSFLDRFFEGIGFRKSMGRRFFQINMDACTGGSNGDRNMPVVGGSYDNGIHSRFFNQVLVGWIDCRFIIICGNCFPCFLDIVFKQVTDGGYSDIQVFLLPVGFNPFRLILAPVLQAFRVHESKGLQKRSASAT